MAKVFWEQFIKIKEIEIKIDEGGLTAKEKSRLLTVIYQTFDNQILASILSHLPQEKHQDFLDQFSQKPHHPDLLDYLKEEIEDIEERITQLAQQIEQQILQELA